MKVRWGAYKATLGCSLTLSSGIEPATFTVLVAPPIDGKIPTTADLTLDDESGGSITIFDCAAISGTVERTTNDITPAIVAQDWRWKWHYGEPIAGEYNRRDAAGKQVDAPADYESAADLASLCLDNLEIPGGNYDVGGMPTDEFPTVDWQYENPAEALHDLCQRYGVLICPQLDGTVKLIKPGEGEDLPGGDRVSFVIDQKVNRLPSKVTLVGRRERYQVDVPLEAVVKNPTGLNPYTEGYSGWVTTDSDECVFKPEGGWYFGFEQDVEATGDNTKEEIQQLAEGVMRAYRFTGDVTIGDTTYNRLDASARWLNSLVEFDVVTSSGVDEKRYRAPYISGARITLGASRDGIGEVDVAGGFVDVPWSFDPYEGIIWFDERVFALNEGKVVGATLTLTAAFEGDYWTQEYDFDDGEAGLYARYPAYDLGEDYIDGATQNYGEIFTEGTKRIVAYKRNLDVGIGTGQTETYPGIQSINLTGKILQVTWSIDGGNITTTASRDVEHDLEVAPREERNQKTESAAIIKRRRSEINRNYQSAQNERAGNITIQRQIVKAAY